ncbi:hypothetical protein HK097_001680 [Rhizophlyctis rosea]|uniref:Mitochondrial carrier protein n=1 Tax=Rhizophlyctis rosea TaxID=64517 RepID=A0AAD5X6S6_9FUNG|nr:hypothetical protein HK097_001680 [Rhizophlyctis rosea]
MSDLHRYKNNFVAGGTALATAFAIMHPLDTMKTRMQASTSAGASGSINIRSLFNIETARVLGRGFVASVAGAGPQGGLRLATYEFTKTHILATSPTRSSNSILPSFGPIPASALSAIAGDFVSSIIKVPREVVTARLQAGHYEAPAGHGPVGTTDVVRSILRQDGLKGLFRGFWSTTARDWPFMVILFTTYESFKQYHHHITFPVVGSSRPFTSSSSVLSPIEERVRASIEEEMEDHVPITTFKSTLFGGISGFLAGYLTTPFDVIKTKIMLSSRSGITIGGVAKALYAQQRQMLSANSHGNVGALKPASVFFTGAVARSSWWFCVCSMFFPVYEGMKGFLREQNF